MADYDAHPGRNAPPEPELSQAQLEADDGDLHAGLTGVAGIVADARGVNELLGDVAELAVQAIPGVDGAGVTLINSCEDTLSVETWEGDSGIRPGHRQGPVRRAQRGAVHHLYAVAAAHGQRIVGK